jgi:hypothetical protein
MLNGLATRLRDATKQGVISAGGRGGLQAGPTGKSGWLSEKSISSARQNAVLPPHRSDGRCRGIYNMRCSIFALVRLQGRARGTFQGALLYASLKTISGLLIFHVSQ